MKVNVNQIDSVGLTLFVQQASSGAAFSGSFVNYVASSGWLGPNVVSTTGGSQDVSGVKRFTNPIGVVYAGGTGDTVAQLFVTDRIASASGALNTALTTISGALESGNSAFTVTGSTIVNVANITGGGNVQVTLVGGQLVVSGAAGGGSASVQVTGSSAISAPNITGKGSVTATYDGTYVILSGAPSAGGAPNAVFTTGVNLLTGISYTFTGSPLVAAPTLPSGAVNLVYLSGFSGVMTGAIQATSGVLNFQMTGASGALAARDLAISGALQAQIGAGGGTTSNFAITGTGTINIALNASGNMTNTINVSGNATNTFNATGTFNNTFNGSNVNTFNVGVVTGNFVNMSFYFEAYNLNTGLNLIETFVGRNFTFTGYAVGAQTSGTQGFLSGSLYQRTQINGKVPFAAFSFNSGMFVTGVGGLSQTISGLNRVGLDIVNLGTGMTGVTVGLFGVGY